MGGRRTKRQRKADTIRRNARQGKAGEDQAMFKDQLSGWETERTGHGSDYIRRKRDMLTGQVVRTEHVEVKTGRAKLSPLQRKTKRKKSNYVVKHENPWAF